MIGKIEILLTDEGEILGGTAGGAAKLDDFPSLFKSNEELLACVLYGLGGGGGGGSFLGAI